MIEQTAGGKRRRGVSLTPAAGYLARAAGGLTLVATFLSLAGVLVVAALPLFGYRSTIVQGGSMEPGLKAGTLVVTRPVQPAALAVGDIIKYQQSAAAAPVTHRIVAIREVDGRLAFTTRGDANDTPDPNEIGFSTDVQKVVFAVPYAGFIFGFARSVQGMLLLVALPAIGLAILSVMTMGGRKPASGRPESARA